MANLYELEAQIQACIRMDDGRVVDTETGEIMDFEAFQNLKLARDKKIENLCLYIKNEAALAEMIKAEKQKLDARQKAHEREALRCKEFLAEFLNGERFESALVKVSYRNSKSVVIDNLDIIPDEYLKYSDPEPRKAEISKAIQLGVYVPGASLQTKKNMIIK